eukprot:14541124-Ditylum_brightwellii.AAC.1
MLAMSSKDAVTHVALDLIHHLANLAPTAPVERIGDEQLDALCKLATIFKTALPTEQVPQQQLYTDSKLHHIKHTPPAMHHYGNTRVDPPTKKVTPPQPVPKTQRMCPRNRHMYMPVSYTHLTLPTN